MGVGFCFGGYVCFLEFFIWFFWSCLLGGWIFLVLFFGGLGFFWSCFLGGWVFCDWIFLALRVFLLFFLFLLWVYFVGGIGFWLGFFGGVGSFLGLFRGFFEVFWGCVWVFFRKLRGFRGSWVFLGFRSFLWG